jgi:activator of HSP90 ATPase
MFMTIEQSITFEGISADELYDCYLDPVRHSTLLGAPVKISARPGTAFWAFSKDGVRGRTLFTHPNRVIAQSWRGTVWAEDDPDSILTLGFEPDGPGRARLQLVQAGVPDYALETIDTGWHLMYWRPWRDNLHRVTRA